MQLVKINPGSDEWFQFRRTHIGASDAMSIMGTSPWKSILKLYEEKIFGFDEIENSYMARGKALEPIAIENFEEETGLSVFPLVFEHDKYKWMSCSFDGITLDQKYIVEVKCPGAKDHSVAVNEMIPPKKYLPQLQHQIFMAGLDFAYYYSFDGDKGKILEVKRDQAFIEKMIEEELKFWHCLQKLTPPKKIKL